MAKKRKPKPKKRRLSKPPPTCKAILLCDAIIVDALSGKLSLIGMFENFNLQSIPGRTVRAQIFLQLTNAQGKYSLKVEVHDLHKDAIIARGGGIELEFANKLQKINAWLPLPPLPIRHEGKYDLVVFGGDSEIDRQQFQVKLVVPPRTEGDA